MKLQWLCSLTMLLCWLNPALAQIGAGYYLPSKGKDIPAPSDSTWRVDTGLSAKEQIEQEIRRTLLDMATKGDAQGHWSTTLDASMGLRFIGTNPSDPVWMPGYDYKQRLESLYGLLNAYNAAPQSTSVQGFIRQDRTLINPSGSAVIEISTQYYFISSSSLNTYHGWNVLEEPIAYWSPVFGNDVHVRGYFRQDGTYVDSYWRTAPDSTTLNNFSHYGNVNPYTGEIGRKR